MISIFLFSGFLILILSSVSGKMIPLVLYSTVLIVSFGNSIISLFTIIEFWTEPEKSLALYIVINRHKLVSRINGEQWMNRRIDFRFKAMNFSYEISVIVTIRFLKLFNWTSLINVFFIVHFIWEKKPFPCFSLVVVSDYHCHYFQDNDVDDDDSDKDQRIKKANQDDDDDDLIYSKFPSWINSPQFRSCHQYEYIQENKIKKIMNEVKNDWNETSIAEQQYGRKN